MAQGDHYGFTCINTEFVDDGVLLATLNRPERRNAISPEMHAELTPLFRAITEDRSVRVAILTGAGDKAFCAGADYGGMQDNLDASYLEGMPELMYGSADLVRALSSQVQRRSPAGTRSRSRTTSATAARPGTITGAERQTQENAASRSAARTSGKS